MRCAGVGEIGPGSPIPAFFGQSARTPPSARLGLGKPDSDHYTNLIAQVLEGLNHFVISCFDGVLSHWTVLMDLSATR